MFITVTNRFGDYPTDAKSQLFLTWDNWNDFSFYTLFGIFYIDDKQIKHDLGGIKIGYLGQQIDETKLNIGDEFEQLDDIFFSVGLDFEYYERLNELGEEVRDKILFCLRDIAKNKEIYQKAIIEEVTKVSLIRDLSELTITGQFRRLANGGIALTPFKFSYVSPKNNSTSLNLSFDVEPFSNPPTNIHVIIGKNGVGKTFLINNMINSLTILDDRSNSFGKFQSLNSEDKNLFANLICVTFSAFDEFEHPPEKRDKSGGIQYSYIGLKAANENSASSEPMNTELLADEFVKSIISCINSAKMNLWHRAIKLLESDSIFRASNFSSLKDFKNTDGLMIKHLTEAFKKLSSGHKIVLLTITKLVEKIQEKSLVLIDEPECHLHPPLLSSFTRALSDLLAERNGVSLIATHSPVILQEVPRSCVWKLRRNGAESVAERLQIESFGENVGILTQEVFGLEVTNSGFHQLLKDLVKENHSYEDVIYILNNQVGLEAKAILRSLFYHKNNSDEENS